MNKGDGPEILDVIEEVVWEGSPTVFGSIVSSSILLNYTYSFIYIYKFLNPLLIQSASSPVGLFLDAMKNIYALVC